MISLVAIGTMGSGAGGFCSLGHGGNGDLKLYRPNYHHAGRSGVGGNCGRSGL